MSAPLTLCKGSKQLEQLTEFVYTTISKQFSNGQTYWLLVCLTGSEKHSTVASVRVDYVCKCGVCVCAGERGDHVFKYGVCVSVCGDYVSVNVVCVCV